MTRDVVQGTLWAFVALVLVKVAGFASGILTARLLGPAGRGELTALMTWLGLFAALGSMGIDQATCLLVGRRPSREAAIVRAAASLALAISLPVALVLVPGVAASVTSSVGLVTILACSLPAILVGQVLLAADQGAFRFGRRAVLLAVQPGLYVVGLGLVAVLGVADVRSVVVAYVAAAAIALVVRGACFRHSLWRTAAPSRGPMRQLAALGLRLQLPHLAAVAIQRLDVLLLAALVATDDVGHYAVAAALAFATAGALEAFGRVAFARLAAAPGSRAAVEILRRDLRAALAIAIAVAVPTIAAAPWLVRVLFGAAYAPAGSIARWLVAAWAVLGLVQWLDQALRALGRTAPGLLALGTGLGLVALGGPRLVQTHGTIGMAWALLIASAVVLAILLAYVAHLARVDAPPEKGVA